MTFNRWLEFVDDYLYIDRINVPRWANFNPQCEVLHAICDAFEKAYIAILYSRVITPSGEFVIHLLAAKIKVVPILFTPLRGNAMQLYWQKRYFHFARS